MRRTINKKVGWLFGIGAIVGTLVVISLLFLNRIEYSLTKNLVFEINSEVKVEELFEEIKFGILENDEERVNTLWLGEKSQNVTIRSLLGTKKEIEVFMKLPIRFLQKLVAKIL